MILRVVSGRVRSGGLPAVVDAYRRGYVPVAEQAPGLARYIVAARQEADGGHALAVVTLWTSVEAAAKAYSGDLRAVRTLDAIDHGEELSHVDYFEVDASEARHEPGTPTLLRLTAGRVARGLDADIQQELRRRLPGLPAEVLEAYVGRRVLGVEVEIAFVSTWAASLPGQALDGPLWPSISDRYDSFRVEVHDVLFEGGGAA